MVDLEIKLPEGFLNEEVRCGFTVTKKMKEVWAVEIDLLSRFLQACDKYGLHCYADAGTLLGAVRHKGFIPWDDDIDLVMFRDDYEKMIKIARKGEFEAPYFFQSVYTEKHYPRGHAQFRNSLTTGVLQSEYGKNKTYNQGIFIDIFVLDGVPKTELKFKITRKIYYTLGKLKGRFLTRSWILFKFIFWLQDLCLKSNRISSCTKVAPLGFIFEKVKRIRNKSMYDETVYMPFEFITIPTPSEYENFLNHRYADWRTPTHVPTTHGGVIQDTDIPYTEYLKTK